MYALNLHGFFGQQGQRREFFGQSEHLLEDNAAVKPNKDQVSFKIVLLYFWRTLLPVRAILLLRPGAHCFWRLRRY